ncbi:MAG: hypothetical protein ACK4IX_14220 [Candidatus Sericytochromatia bacterium]
MKNIILSILSSLFLLSNPVQAQINKDIIDLVKNSKSISENYTKSFHVPNDKGALIIGEDFISYIELLDNNTPSNRSSNYKFRTFSLKHKVEISGEGKVFEHYYSVKDPFNKKSTVTVIDKGSVLEIDAGLFKVEWSAGRYLYLNSNDIKIQESTEQMYEEKIKK